MWLDEMDIRRIGERKGKRRPLLQIRNDSQIWSGHLMSGQQ